MRFVWVSVCCLAVLTVLLVGCSSSRESPETVKARDDMVDRLASNPEMTNDHVLNAMRKTPRQFFLPEAQAPYAYSDDPNGYMVPLCNPRLVALALQEMDPQSTHKVLMVEPPTGYPAAVAARLCSRVIIIVTSQERADGMSADLGKAGAANVEVHACDTMQGWGAAVPYDALMACVWGGQVPDRIVDQLSDGATVVTYDSAQTSRITVMKVSERELGTARYVSLRN